ncbi:MAG TPA: hypothetical protein VKG38_05000, partial [Solirubrobacteraceae bacterium]|nr:hypothetical protein [Solirubrobacteraceae bacterium]
VAVVLSTAAATAITAGAASASEVIYSNLPSTNPGNVVSEAFEATQTSQFGGLVEFPAGTGRSGGAVTVGMSSWACQQGAWKGTPECVTAAGAKYEYPITLNVYEAGPANEVGALIRTVTKTFDMPYRPSQNNTKCKNEKGEPDGAWYDGHLKQCFHGKFFKITFPVGHMTWPTKAIVSVSYNTSDYGTEPQRPKPCDSESGGCFYDSLNVGLTEPPNEASPTPVPPSVGADPLAESVYQNTKYAPYWCDGGAGGTGTFRLDSGCWTGYQPLIRVKAG